MPDSIAQNLQAWIWFGAIATGLLALVLGGYWLVLRLARKLLGKRGAARLFLDHAGTALGVVLALLTLKLAAQGAPADLPFMGLAQHVSTLALIVALTWAAVGCSAAVGEIIVYLNPPLEWHSRQARKIETQTRFITRALNILIVLVGIGAALMTFPTVQQLGTSLLASAGIGGIILGFAARPVLTNLLAGMQIALTQPFRIDDVLYVEGEWCWVEEVTSTYVVLRVWDLRRMVMPLQWFIDHPFENWSRNETHLLGTIFLWVDYRMPLEPLREAFARIVRASAEWDGETELVQVTDAGPHGIQVRFLVGAANSSANWTLRCHVREALIAFMQSEYPEHLPQQRARLLEQDQTPPTAGISGPANHTMAGPLPENSP